jgi:hypothetical protein
MHLIYRSKKQTLPIVHDAKLQPYMSPPHQPPLPLFQKKSIEIILDRHITPFTPSSQALYCYKPQKKTLYRAKSRKAESGYLKIAGRGEHSESKGGINRNKSTQIVERVDLGRKRGESEYSPYMMGQRKSGSAVKLKVGDEVVERDWICERLIEKEVYGVEEGSDFS